MTFYAVALILPDKIEKELDRLRNGYSKQMVYISIPHLTLAYPFVPTVKVPLLTNKLKQVAERTKPFILILKGIDYFAGRNNVAYIAVGNKRPLVELHRDITFALEGLCKDELKDDQGNFNLDRYVPHVTIGEQIPDDLFPKIKQKLAESIIDYKIKMTSFSLFVKTQDEEWTLGDKFIFSG